MIKSVLRPEKKINKNWSYLNSNEVSYNNNNNKIMNN